MNGMSSEKITDATQRLLSALQADARSSSEIARLAEVSQPTVSRMRTRASARARRSESFNKLCIFYGLAIPKRTVAVDGYNDLLKRAVIDAWDGSDAHGEALLQVLKGLKELRVRTHKPRGG